MKEKPTATVDGREVPVEIIESCDPAAGGGGYRTVRGWKAFLPLVGLGTIFVGVIFLSLFLFIWAIPFLLPLSAAFFLIRLFRRM